jgi:transcriptional regulator with XRE-family HTH domain
MGWTPRRAVDTDARALLEWRSSISGTIPMATTVSPSKIRQVQLVGRRIRRLRKERHLTQTELSARIGVQQSDLSRMEKGEYRVSLDTLFKILAEFDVSIGEFFDDMAKESFSPREVRMVREFKALAPEAQREVEEFITFKHGKEQVPGDGR